MKKKCFLAIAAFLFVLPVAVSGAQSEEAGLPLYTRILIADPEYQNNDPAVESLIVDEARSQAYSGDAAVVFESCSTDWLCMALGGSFLIVIPKNCNQIESGASWLYRGRTYRVVTKIGGVADGNDGDSRYLISIDSDAKSEEVLVIYSVNRGVESFATTEGKRGRKLLVQYYLSSKIGALAGGCVVGGGS